MARDSFMFNFIKEALLDEKYLNMKWINKDERTFHLYCPLKSKNYWNPLYEQIFDDYAKLKPRKSSDNRQRFLQAMKASPFINLLKNKSSNENKYYQFWEHGRSLSDEIDSIKADEVGELEVEDMQVVQLPNSSKSGHATGGASAGNKRNDLDNFSSPLLAVTHDSTGEASTAVNYNGEIQNDIHELLSRVNVPEANVLDNEANCLSPLLAGSNNSLLDSFVNDEIRKSTKLEIRSGIEDYMMVPNIAVSNLGTPDNVASASFFYPDFSQRGTLSCNEVKHMSNPSSLEKEESSYTFVPPDYDPEKDFIQSCGIPTEIEVNQSPTISKDYNDQLGSAQVMMPNTSEEPSKCEITGVFPLNGNGDIVKHLQLNSSSMSEKRYFMMILKTG